MEQIKKNMIQFLKILSNNSGNFAHEIIIKTHHSKMKRHLLTTKTMLLAVIWMTMMTNSQAADRFVVFQSEANSWQLKDLTIGYSEAEHSCVRLAAANLAADFEKVTGTKSLTSAPSSPTSILIGTVGVNKQIDQWVKQGILRELKGKTEKFIIKTIGSQLVIAGSDKRGTVYGIYELSRQMGVSPWY